MIQSKVGVISGKFRLLHQGHKELMIHAMGLCEQVHIIIVDEPTYQRYSTIKELKQAMGKIYHQFNFTNFKIHVVYGALSAIDWDKKVLELVPNIDIIFNSKEDYPNFLIKNQYIETFTGSDVSVTAIEKNIISNMHLIAAEFRPYINKKIVVTGIESCGKTTIVKKLASFLDTSFSIESGRNYSDRYLGLQETTFRPKDFVHIVMEQTLQDKNYNLFANKYLIVDTDPIVTLYYLDLYKQDMMESIDEKEYNQAYSFIETVIENYRDKVDLILYLEPLVPFVEDGKRWNKDEQKRQVLNKRLKALYDKYNITYHIIDSIGYDERFNDCLKAIHKLKIEPKNRGLTTYE